LEDFGKSWPDPKGLTWLLDSDYREPPLLEENVSTTRDILATFERELNRILTQQPPESWWETLKTGATTNVPLRRFLALASVNFCHFGAQPWDGSFNEAPNEALHAYRYYHRRALAQAEVAGQWPDTADARQAKIGKLLDALVVEAFACHFLTDLFASGHIRVPRREIAKRFGVIKGSLIMSKAMHDEDNRMGLFCTTLLEQTPRIVWRAVGDGELLKGEAELHLAVVQEAVRRSAGEVFLRFCGTRDVQKEQTAEALLPVPLAAGSAPLPTDVHPFELGSPPSGPPNHFPLYILASDSGGRSFIAERINGKDPYCSNYAESGVHGGAHFSLSGQVAK
jgi:hypothetical protein